MWRSEEESRMPQQNNVIAELTSDHREVEALFERLEAVEPGDKQAAELVDQITIELVRHSVAEEQYLYPAVRESVPGGDAMAAKEIGDHAKVELLLKDLQYRPADDESFKPLTEQLIAEVASHVKDEEERLFPALLEACSFEQLDDLGEQVREAKRTAPTRPHPPVPDDTPAGKLVGAGAGLVDRVRDMLTGRGK